MPDRPLPTEVEEYFQRHSSADIRFEFEIIKHLSESIRTQTSMIAEMQHQQSDILVRLERIEAKEHGEQLAACLARIDLLEQEYQRRVGRDSFIASIMKSPLVAWLVAAVGAVYVFVKEN